MDSTDLIPIKQIPILEVAQKLGIQVQGKRAMCFSGHDKHTPSLHFLPRKNTWKCFGACGKGGDVISLVMEALKCDFKTALAWFADEFHVEIRQDRSRQTSRCFRTNKTKKNQIASEKMPVRPLDKGDFSADTELYEWFMNRCGPVAQKQGLQYLDSHGILLDLANRFDVCELRDPVRAFHSLLDHWGEERVYRSGITWGNNGHPERLIWTSYALIFPFFDNNKMVYLQGRIFKGSRKFLNLRGVSKPLYNVDGIRMLPPGSVVHICEGIPDALALEACKITAVAVLGATSFRAEWVDMFKWFDVVLMPDGDSGGDIFKQKISEIFKSRGKAVRTVHVPMGKDVADVIAELKGKTWAVL